MPSKTGAGTSAFRCRGNAVLICAVRILVIEDDPEIADDRGHRSVVQTAPATGGVTISGDAIRLRQAVANLIDNALKCTPEGGRIELSARAEVHSNGRDGAIFMICDSGPGVPDAEQPRIWERLYRCDQSRSKTDLGLRLSLVRAVVNAHSGQASVRNAPRRRRGF